MFIFENLKSKIKVNVIDRFLHSPFESLFKLLIVFDLLLVIIKILKMGINSISSLFNCGKEKTSLDTLEPAFNIIKENQTYYQ